MLLSCYRVLCCVVLHCIVDVICIAYIAMLYLLDESLLGCFLFFIMNGVCRRNPYCVGENPLHANKNKIPNPAPQSGSCLLSYARSGNA